MEWLPRRSRGKEGERPTKMLGNIGLVRLIASFIPHDESPDYTHVPCLQDVLCTWGVLGVSKMKRDQDQEKRELSTLPYAYARLTMRPSR
jgi:hypothetical protein